MSLFFSGMYVLSFEQSGKATRSHARTTWALVERANFVLTPTAKTGIFAAAGTSKLQLLRDQLYHSSAAPPAWAEHP